MRGSEHMAFAVLTTGGALYAMGNGHVEIAAIAAVSVAAVGSLVPDIDHPKAWISNRIPATLALFGLVFLLLFGLSNWYVSRPSSTDLTAAVWTPLVDAARPLLVWAVIASVLGIALFVLALVVASLVEHRGPTHSLVVGAALTLVACIGFAVVGAAWTLGLWFGWGYLSHLLADLVTPMGCPALLWPLRSGELLEFQGMGPRLLAREATRRREPSPISNARQHPGAVGASQPNDPRPCAPKFAGAAAQTEEVGMQSRLVEPTLQAAQQGSNACPKCGGALVMREARHGNHVGNMFYGCANYPKCRHIESIAG